MELSRVEDYFSNQDYVNLYTLNEELVKKFLTQDITNSTMAQIV